MRLLRRKWIHKKGHAALIFLAHHRKLTNGILAIAFKNCIVRLLEFIFVLRAVFNQDEFRIRRGVGVNKVEACIFFDDVIRRVSVKLRQVHFFFYEIWNHGHRDIIDNQ